MLRERVKQLLQVTANGFMAGTTVNAARPKAHDLTQQGFNLTLGYWNGAAETVTEIGDVYHRLMKLASKIGESAYVSCKAPAVEFDEPLFEGLSRSSLKHGTRIQFDSLWISAVNATNQLALKCSALGAVVGVTLPGRWRRSLRDANWACDQSFCIRVVKGEFPGDGSDETEPSKGFLDVVKSLKGAPVTVGVATHDAELARKALDILIDSGTSCELELLAGMPRRRLTKLTNELAVPLRLYLPFGTAYGSYILQYCRRHPVKALSWMVRGLSDLRT